MHSNPEQNFYNVVKPVIAYLFHTVIRSQTKAHDFETSNLVGSNNKLFLRVFTGSYFVEDREVTHSVMTGTCHLFHNAP